eukprot:452482_1
MPKLAKDQKPEKSESGKKVLSTGKKRKAVVLTRQDRKELKKKRHAERPNADVAEKVKVLWRLNLQQKSAAERKEIVKEAIDSMSGKIFEVVMKNDVSRALEICLKHASREDAMRIYTELKGKLAELVQHKYGHHVVLSLLKRVASGMKVPILDEFSGMCAKLLIHRFAATTLDFMFRECLSGKQRKLMLQEFFLPSSSNVAFQELGEDGLPLSLSDVIARSPAKRQPMMETLRQFLLKALSKEMVTTAIVHHLLAEYFLHASPEQEAELADQLAGVTLQVQQTKLGCVAIVRCLSFASSKHRKVFVKAFKGFVGEMAQDDFGWWVISRSLSVVDDTVLLKNVILKELVACLIDDTKSLQFLQNRNFAKTLLQVLAPGVRRYFTEEDREILPEPVVQSTATDGQRANCKKDRKVKREQILLTLFEPLRNACQTHMMTIYKDKCASDLLFEVATECCRRPLDESKLFLDRLTECIFSGTNPLDGPEHRQVKRLILQVSSESADSDSVTHFLGALLTRAQQSGLAELVVSRAAFVLVVLLEQKAVPGVAKDLRKALKPLKKSLKKDARAASKLILQAMVKKSE